MATFTDDAAERNKQKGKIGKARADIWGKTETPTKSLDATAV